MLSISSIKIGQIKLSCLGWQICMAILQIQHPTRNSLFCDEFAFFFFFSHQKLMSCFAFCSVGCFLASRGLYLITVSMCVDTLSALSQQNPCTFLLCEPHKHIRFESWALRLASSASLAPFFHSLRSSNEPKSWVIFPGLPEVSKHSHVLYLRRN